MADHADPITDAILDHALSASGVFRQELLAALNRRLGPLWDQSDPQHLVNEARAVLEDHVGILARLVSDAGLAAWLHGAASVAREVPQQAIAAPIGFGPAQTPAWQGMRAWAPVVAGAVEDLRSRPVVTRDEYDTMSDTARRDAFTVAYTASADAVGKVKNALEDAIAEGQTFGEFRNRMAEDVDTSTLGTGHLATVFRTAAARSYAAGMDRVLEDPVVQEVFPFSETVGITDSRQTELCDVIGKSGLDRTGIYLNSDPVWSKFKPPRHFNCRCSRRGLSVADAAARGIRYAQEWQRKGEQPLPLAHVPHPSVDLPEGWTPPTQMSLAEPLAWLLAVNRAPVGGVTLNGKQYRGGMFIPSQELAKAEADPTQAAAVEAVKSKKSGAESTLAATGPVNHADLKARLVAHQPHTVEPAYRAKVNRTYASLKTHHGELVGHRLRQLIDTDLADLAADKTRGKDGHPLTRRLAALHAMVVRAEKEFPTASVDYATSRSTLPVSPAVQGGEAMSAKKVEYVRAAAGGQVSDVDGKTYKGGQLMPIHGLYSGQERVKGTGQGSPPIPPSDEEGKGKKREPPIPLTPEQISERHEDAKRQTMIREIKNGPLEQLSGINAATGRPFTPGRVGFKQWKELAERVGEPKLQQIMAALPPPTDPLDREEYDIQLNHPQDFKATGPKKHHREYPTSANARFAVSEALRNAKNLDDIYRIHKIISSPLDAVREYAYNAPVAATETAASTKGDMTMRNLSDIMADANNAYALAKVAAIASPSTAPAAPPASAAGDAAAMVAAIRSHPRGEEGLDLAVGRGADFVTTEQGELHVRGLPSIVAPRVRSALADAGWVRPQWAKNKAENVFVPAPPVVPAISSAALAGSTASPPPSPQFANVTEKNRWHKKNIDPVAKTLDRAQTSLKRHGQIRAEVAEGGGQVALVRHDEIARTLQADVDSAKAAFNAAVAEKERRSAALDAARAAPAKPQKDPAVTIRGNTFAVRAEMAKIPGARIVTKGGKKVWTVPAEHAARAKTLVASAPASDPSELLRMNEVDLAERGLVKVSGPREYVRRATEEELHDILD